MIWNQLELNSRLEAALRAVSRQAAQWYGEYAPLLATKVDARWRERAGGEWASGMFESRLQHTKCVHACLLLGSHRCLLETLHWAYGSWVARGLAVDRFRVELEAWREVVREEAGNRAEGAPLVHLYDVLVQAHETFCSMAGKGPGDPLREEQLPQEAQLFLASLLTGSEPVVDVQPNLRSWWEGVVGPALRTVGKLWSEGCVSVAEEHVATAIVQQVMRRSLPAKAEPTKDQSVAVVVPAGEWHTVGAEIVRDSLRVEGYRVFYTGANTPLDGLVPLVEWNHISHLLISTTIASGLLQVSEMVEMVKEKMGDRRPRIVVGGQAYRLDAGLGQRVGADVCLQGLGELGDYLVRESRGGPRLMGCDGEHTAGASGARADSDFGSATR
ncbi:MAG: cobalamin-dependent protein [Bryobacteraceae bacterium]